jgi:hypothetical protein
MYKLTQRERNTISSLVAEKGPLLREVDADSVADLVQEILSDDCVALVGAGFSACVSPQWSDLIKRTANILTLEIPHETVVLVERYIDTGRFEAAAEVLQSATSKESFHAAISEALLSDQPSDGLDKMNQRTDLIDGIPFRGVLTTNFDGQPRGRSYDRSAYRSLLRPQSDGFMPREPRTSIDGKTIAVELHGNIGGSPEDLVVTTGQYRELIHNSPGYRTFLRSLMATRTMLLLGKSLEDQYLNDLRSEVLALFDHSPAMTPIAYAAMNATEVDHIEAEYLRDHEGIEVLRYSDEEDGDHAGFDALLEVLSQATNFTQRTRRLLKGHRILWLDTNRSGWAHADVTAVIDDLEEGLDPIFDRVETPDEALRKLQDNGGEPYDLFITNWGWNPGEEPTGLMMLNAVHAGGYGVPVLVFAAPGYPENRALALRAGAAEFVTTHARLYRRMYDIVDAVTLM